MIAVGYLYYTILLLIVTGILMLSIDANMYKAARMFKEQKTALVLGWFHLILSVACFVASILLE